MPSNVVQPFVCSYVTDEHGRLLCMWDHSCKAKSFTWLDHMRLSHAISAASHVSVLSCLMHLAYRMSSSLIICYLFQPVRNLHWLFKWHMQVIVITGDNKLTAEAICQKVGVFAVGEDLTGKSITGVEFMKLPLDKRRAMLQGHAGACFSRAEPKHKQVCGLDTASTVICCPAVRIEWCLSVCLCVCCSPD